MTDWVRVAWQLYDALEAVDDDRKCGEVRLTVERRRQVTAALDAYDRAVRESRRG